MGPESRFSSCVAVIKIKLFYFLLRGDLIPLYVKRNLPRNPSSSEKTFNTMATILSAQQKWDIKVLMALVLLACYHNSIHVCLYLLRAALVPPSHSPWRKLYDKGDSSSFLHVTGLTWEAFDSLLYVVIPPGHKIHRQHRGRPWLLLPDGMLGLLLCYLGSQMTIKWLCLIFGITPTPCSCILKKKNRMTVKQLRFHLLARIKFPEKQKMHRFMEMTSIREPTISNAIGFMDRLGLATEMTDERIEQNVYYCG
jgi:hypothetical protein